MGGRDRRGLDTGRSRIPFLTFGTFPPDFAFVRGRFMRGLKGSLIRLLLTLKLFFILALLTFSLQLFLFLTLMTFSLEEIVVPGVMLAPATDRLFIMAQEKGPFTSFLICKRRVTPLLTEQLTCFLYPDGRRQGAGLAHASVLKYVQRLLATSAGVHG